MGSSGQSGRMVQWLIGGEVKGLVECEGKWCDELKASSITQASR